MSATGFLGVATPSESGVHLLYYFRQENNLQKGISEGADRGISRGARLTTASVRFAPCRKTPPLRLATDYLTARSKRDSM